MVLFLGFCGDCFLFFWICLLFERLSYHVMSLAFLFRREYFEFFSLSKFRELFASGSGFRVLPVWICVRLFSGWVVVSSHDGRNHF